MKKNIFLFFILFLNIYIFASAEILPKKFQFNYSKALEKWQEKVFKDKVLYTVDTETESINALSNSACSGLFYKINVKPEENPMFSWSWKVTEFPNKSNTNTKDNGWIERDDYAARVYVIFPHWNFMKIKSIEYIWHEKLPVGTVLTSPYFNNIKLIVAESGTNHLNTWIDEEHNIYEDYKKAFGKKPSRKIGAIALMTDADNTSSTAEAFYKNIKIGYANE